MSNNITKSDLVDIDFIDAYELNSDGYQTTAGLYLTTTIISTSSSLNEIKINYPSDNEGIDESSEHPAEAGDFVYITGTSGGLGDGYYTIDSVLNATTFTVVESIATSTGGNIKFFYPPGASKIGLNSQNLNNISTNNVQDAFKDVDDAISNINNSSLPLANECGQLLISESDNIFRPNFPIVGDNSGFILMGDNGKIIICG